MKNFLGLEGGEDVRVTSVKDGEDTDTEELTAGGTKLVVTTLEVVDGGLGEHGVVLKLRLAKGRGVAREDHKLGLALADSLEGALVAKSVLARLDDKSELGVNSLLVLLSFGGLELVMYGMGCFSVVVARSSQSIETRREEDVDELVNNCFHELKRHQHFRTRLRLC